ncbi:MAG: hypothetical protein LBS65_04620 [Desulfovibrio sp.]|jgi:hypothetical protein|nr:hypothetical protein [Desulfovibrio sp.]
MMLSPRSGASQPKAAFSADDPPQEKVYFSMRVSIKTKRRYCHVTPALSQQERRYLRRKASFQARSAAFGGAYPLRDYGQSGSLMKRVNRSAKICGQILSAKQEQAGFARRKRTVSSVNCSSIVA